MPNSLQPASRHTLPRTLMAGFVLAALATLLIAFVNVRSAETRTRAVKAMDRATETVRQLSLFNSALKDAEIGQRLKGDLRATLSGESTEPALELVAQDGSVLKFVGEPTPETLYGSAGETMFLEVAPKRADCSHPMIPRYQCLMVRERRYNDAGVQLPPQEDWHPLYQSIEGYDHRDGVRTVLRVKRYDWKNPPADAPSKVYVLDLVVEQDASGKKK